MWYPTYIPRWVQGILPGWRWRVPEGDPPGLYLTFDDGPIPEVTPWVLDQLAAYQAQATFFCVGDNVRRHPELFQRLMAEGHQVGNHTMHHLDGWQTPTEVYLANVKEAQHYISSPLFRPPYGRLRWRQATALRQAGHQLVGWELLPGDFDATLTAADCWARLSGRLQHGTIIVLHDSLKAWPRLEQLLPRVLAHGHAQGFQFKAMPLPPTVV